MNQIARDYITEENGKFTVYSHSGKAMGSYPSREEADKRLRQIEYFKNAGDAVDMAPGEMEKLRALLDKFFVEESTESNHQPKIAAGIVFQAKTTGRVLLLKRADTEPNYGGHWGLPGGKAEPGESSADAAMREAREETGYPGDFNIMQEISKVTTPTGMEFTTFLVTLHDEFTPALTDGEHTAWYWADPAKWPTDPPAGEKLHPGVEAVLEGLALSRLQGGAADELAFDKASVRTIDDAGRMHVKSAHISKAAVNPYYGREIPGWEALGLDPDRVYQMFRDPAELEKGAASFNGIQLLIRHIPVSAEDPQRDEIVGTTGTNAEFNHPFLDNELVIWTRNGIDAIESENQRELSCGYGYTPVMEPGEFEGVRYDGRMTDIKGNHVALVSKGRAGPDVIVGDAAMEQHPQEGKMKMTLTAVRLHSALMAGVIAPKIAMDQQLKVSTALATSLAAAKITREGFKDQKAAIVKIARDAAEPALTAEAKKAGGVGPDDVIMRVLDMVEGQVAADPAEKEVDPAGGNDWRQNIMDACMKAGMDEAAAKTICDMFPGAAEGGEDDADDEEEETPEEKAKREKEAEKAMDEQIKTKVDAAVAAERQRSKDAAEARQFVEPWVGKVSLAHDSAEDIYRAALGMLGVKHEAVKDGAALRILVEAQAKPNERRHAISLASDAAPEGKGFHDMFPGAERIGHAA